MFHKQSTGWRQRAAAAASVLSLFSRMLAPSMAAAKDRDQRETPKTPIKHVIVVIGENRTFDHVFAAYKPRKGETVDNLLFHLPGCRPQ